MKVKALMFFYADRHKIDVNEINIRVNGYSNFVADAEGMEYNLYSKEGLKEYNS